MLSESKSQTVVMTPYEVNNLDNYDVYQENLDRNLKSVLLKSNSRKSINGTVYFKNLKTRNLNDHCHNSRNITVSTDLPYTVSKTVTNHKIPKIYNGDLGNKTGKIPQILRKNLSCSKKVKGNFMGT